MAKELQWLMPMVWPPESATTSVGSRFFVASESRISPALLEGGGRFASVSFLVAKFSLSLLPNGTSYSGPPDCNSYIVFHNTSNISMNIVVHQTYQLFGKF